MPKCSPFVAETEVILWALQLAKGELWSNILVESDSKNSIDAILDNTGCSLWTISALISDICFLAKSFVLCLFCWVKRSGNAAAHEAALPSPLYLSPKGLNCRGIAAALAIPTKDPHGEVQGMIRPASLAMESEEKKVETEVEMTVSCTRGKDER
nr:hypothetical protein CFP56_48247 [Quercus suber]